MSAITPAYVAENAPTKARGRITGLFRELLVIGQTIAYWLGYGVAKTIHKSTRRWKIPFGVQMIPLAFS